MYDFLCTNHMTLQTTGERYSLPPLPVSQLFLISTSNTASEAYGVAFQFKAITSSIKDDYKALRHTLSGCVGVIHFHPKQTMLEISYNLTVVYEKRVLLTPYFFRNNVSRHERKIPRIRKGMMSKSRDRTRQFDSRYRRQYINIYIYIRFTGQLPSLAQHHHRHPFAITHTRLYAATWCPRTFFIVPYYISSVRTYTQLNSITPASPFYF